MRIKPALLRYLVIPFVGTLGLCGATSGHDLITTKITWDREIVRIIGSRCTSCHQEGGKAFSLTTYDDARPWAQAIMEETLDRQMPPWGAVKGFGQFSNDRALTQDELDLIANWVDGGAPEGDPNDLPKDAKPATSPQYTHAPGEIMVSGEFKLPQSMVVGGVWPKNVPDKDTIQITAELPDGSIQPLVWLLNYQNDYDHPFIFAPPLNLPAGTQIHGVPQGASIALTASIGKPETAARAEGAN